MFWLKVASIIAGALLLYALFGPWPSTAQGFPCYRLDALLASAQAENKKVEVLSGWLAGMVALVHKEHAPPHSLQEPVQTVILLREKDDSVIVYLQQGEFACAPLRFDPGAWEEVSSDLWGRGA